MALLLLIVLAACENDVFGPTSSDAEPTCQVREAAIDFDAMTVGQTSTEKTFFIRNTGGGTLGGQVALDAGAFEIVSGGGAFSLAPGQLRRVGVRFRPGTPGDHAAQIRLGTACRFVALTGRATPGDACLVSPGTLDFGTVEVGGTAVERTFTMTNTGPTAYSGFVEAPCGSFNIVSGGGLYTLAPSQSREVRVRFAPTGAGNETCLIETGAAACLDVTAVGLATNPAVCEVVPAMLTFGSVCPGAGTERSVTLRNPGTTAFSGSVAVSGADFTLTAGAGPYTLGANETRMVMVRYAPLAQGSGSGTLSFGITTCAPVGLSGEAGTPVVCQLSTSLLDLGSVPQGESATAAFSINNAGCGTASGFVSAGCQTFEVIEGGGAWTLPSGESRVVRVRFTPNTAGSVSCSLDIGGGCAPLSLAGRGFAVPVCVITPELLDFGTVTPNQSRTLQFTIRNDGGGVLSGSVATGCNAFTVTNNSGPYSLAAGVSRTVTVRFLPPNAGERSCLLSLGSTDCPGITLAGVGDALPLCSLSPSVLQFGGVTVNTSAEKSFVVTNIGGGVLSGTISENCNDFEVIEGTGPYGLSGGESLKVTVRFRPTLQALRTCGIGLGSVNCNNVAASGNGTAASLCRVLPTSLDFGTVFIGQSADRSFTLTNLGGTTISGVLAEMCADFTIISGGGPFTLAPGVGMMVTVRFTPSGTGSRLCDIDTGTSDCPPIPASAFGDVEPACQLSATAIDFGTVTVGGSVDRMLTITNSGGGTLTGTLIEDCNDFQIVTGGGSFSLPAGLTRTATIRFRPLTAGTKLCPLVTGSERCGTITLSGVADPMPACGLSTTLLSFPLTPVGASSEISFTLSNTGGGMLDGTISSPCAEFTIVSGGGSYSLAAGVVRPITVRFTPAAAGNRFCTIETGTTRCADLPAQGQGDPPPECRISPPDLAFGSVGINLTAESSFDITNTGGGTLAGIPSINCPDFTIVGGGIPYGLTAGQSHTVIVRFQPTSVGAKNCSIETGSALCADIMATGTGETQPVCNLSTTSLTYGLVTTGQSVDQSFTITNGGGGTLSGSVTESCQAYTIIAGAGGFGLMSGNSRIVTIRFSPTTFGAQNCAIDLGTACAIDVQATGTGAAGFASSVRPILIASGCNNLGCHDGVAVVDLTIYSNATPYGNTGNPPASPILTRPGAPTGDHSGGSFANFQTGQTDYNTVLTWIQQGLRP